MKQCVARRRLILFLLLCLHGTCCSPLNNLKSLAEKLEIGLLPQISPSAPPLAPFTSSTVAPKLSGSCPLNFVALGSMITTTSIDCAAPFAKYLANVICCPQLETTLTILVGQYSKHSKNELALNTTLARHCLSDFQKILAGKGANSTLQQICSLNPSILSEGSCPISNVQEFEATVDSPTLLSSCRKIFVGSKCPEQICESAISEAAEKLAAKAYGLSNVLPDQSTKAKDCQRVVHHWLASKLDPSGAKEVLRCLSSYKNNRVCPLVFPNMSGSIEACKNEIKNQTRCCLAMWHYVSHLQRQNFITNLQAMECAGSLGMKLQKAYVTQDVYKLCHITLKDFSAQVTPEVSGCLLPSSPSDATLVPTMGISSLCGVDNILPAPWPSSSHVHASSSCNKSVYTLGLGSLLVGLMSTMLLLLPMADP
ncbi:unnamed protein product [Cuscuta campestris]|uniref:Uncharacterized protein n=1 Tax=Cuscuta campestris TaxID=132261 RepID=A0A484MKL9_9ASTE|nr:unnamed protein product [Cuscuta campestris]